MLTRIAADATNLPMRLAATQKSGAKSWTQMFDAANGAILQRLGNVLAAVSLFPEVQEDARAEVQQACLNLIRHGDESHIPEMVDLLEGYGSKKLAEGYLASSQPDLAAAGRRWARRHGYSVGTGTGSHHVTLESDS
jgi:hypothetical protein